MNQNLHFLGIAALGLVAGTAVAADRVVVLPLLCVGAPQAACERLRPRLGEALSGRFQVKIIPPAEVDAALLAQCGEPSAWWQCLELDANLFALANRLKARTLVTGKLAAVGETQRFLLRMADGQNQTVASGTIEMSGQDDGPIVLKCLLFGERMLTPVAPPISPGRAWYQHWETWVIGGGVAALVLGGVLLFALPSQNGGGTAPDADWRLKLP